ncbi:MAG: DUF2182 domain-containing protein [Candidatus Limnocylindrales bacterium]
MTTAVQAASHTARVPGRLVLWMGVALAWLAIVVADATGLAGALHHHSLLENGPPLPIAVGLFLVGWQVMIAAMMLPASSVAITGHATAVAARGSIRFVLAYLAAWSVFGLVCFAGDGVIHRLVNTTPWLAANAWIIPAVSLAGAGVYQLLPVKRRFIAACRVTGAEHHRSSAVGASAAHGLDCIGASGPLMLLMFAAGFASLAWMVALAALMFYEVRGAHSTTVIHATGVLLIWLSLMTSISGAVPGWAGT